LAVYRLCDKGKQNRGFAIKMGEKVITITSLTPAILGGDSLARVVEEIFKYCVIPK